MLTACYAARGFIGELIYFIEISCAEREDSRCIACEATALFSQPAGFNHNHTLPPVRSSSDGHFITVRRVAPCSQKSSAPLLRRTIDQMAHLFKYPKSVRIAILLRLKALIEIRITYAKTYCTPAIALTITHAQPPGPVNT